jgi:hypothetical protein
MSAGARQPRVVLERRSLASLRRGAAAFRILVALVATAGVAASARLAIAPPAPRVTVVRPQSTYDAAAAFSAEQFARSYLSWGPGTGAGSGRRPASASSDSVSWLEIAATRAAGPDAAGYVVAADTSLHGVVYLELELAARGPGRYALTRYPAFVAAPSPPGAAASLDGAELPALANGQLERVLRRALGHYLDDDRGDLAADLADGAAVSSPTLHLALRQIVRLAAEPTGAVLATLVASDAQGNAYTLTYSVGVVLTGGRWELTSINPGPRSASGPQT